MRGASAHSSSDPMTPPPVEAGARVGRNTAFRACAQALSALINVAAVVMLGNHLSASGYGEYAYYYALIPLLASLCDLGAGVIVTREMARHREEAARLLGDGLLLRVIVGSLLLLAGAVAGPVLAPAHAGLVLLVTAAAVFDFSQDIAVWRVRAHERLDLEAVLLLVSQIAWLVGIAAVLRFGGSLEALIGVAVAAYLLRSLAGMAMLARLGLGPRFAPEPGHALERVLPRRAARLRGLVAEGWPVGLALLLVVVYGRVGVFTLKAFGHAADVGCFNIAYMLSQPFGFLASALSMAAFPAFSRLRGGEPRELARPLRAALKYQLLVALPIAAGLVLVADAIVPVMFHDRSGFGDAGAALRVMALAIPCVFLNLHARYLLAALDRQRRYLAAVALGLAVNVVGCIATARAFGALGAAWTFVAAEAVVFVVCQRALPAESRLWAMLAEVWRPLGAVALMAAAVLAARPGGLAAQLAAGAIAYPVALVLTRALSREDRALIRGVAATFTRSGGPRVVKTAGHA